MFRGFLIAGALAFLAPVTGAVVFVTKSDATTGDKAASAKPGAALVAAPPVSFSGTTSQKMAIAFEHAAGGRRIEGLEVTYRAECGKGALSFELDDTFYTPVAVAADGTFSVRGIGKRLMFKGKIVGGSASGTLRLDYEYGGLFHCTTPAMRWTAAHPA